MQIEPLPSVSIERHFTKNKDVDKQILLLLSYRDLLQVCQASRYTRELCSDNQFWRNKIRKDFPKRGANIYYTEYLQLWENNARKLYEIINSPSKIIELDESSYPRLSDIDIPDENGDIKLDPRDGRRITDAILPHLDKLPLLRGDVIHLGWTGNYLNDGKFIWTGEKVIDLDYDIDEDGNVPQEFSFPEFPFAHFYHSIAHNTILWLSPSTIQEAINNYQEDKKATTISDSYYSYYPIYASRPRKFINQITEFPLIEFIDP